MATTIIDHEGTRTLTFESGVIPGSFFISGPEGFCMEFDRANFAAMIAAELDLLPIGIVSQLFNS